MADIFDLISTLTGGQTAATALGPAGALGPIAPVAGPALAPAMQGLAQWANVPGPPQSVGDVFDRLGRFLHAANTLGGAAGMIATQPYFARQAQIANAPGLANIPLPWVAGMAGTSLAIPSLLPGGQQVAESLGIAPPTGYGDIIGPAYQASAEQGGGLAGLGAALDKLAETYSATPETVPLTKFIGENVSNPINYLGAIAKAPGLIGQAGRGTQAALNLPFEAAKAGFSHIPYFSELSDASKQVLHSRQMEDLVRNVTANIDALGLPTPEMFGTGAAADPRLRGVLPFAAATAAPAEDAAILKQSAETATANADAAKATIADRLAGGAGVSDIPAAAPTAEAAGAAAAAGAPAAALGAVPSAAEAAAGPAHTIKWYNDRAQGSYRFAQEASEAVLGHKPPPATDIPLDTLRGALDPGSQAETWLATTLDSVAKEGVAPGRVVAAEAKAQRRLGYQRGGGPGLTSARTGELLFEPETQGQVSFAVGRLQARGDLPPGEPVRLATTLRWMEDQYGATFPAPPPGEQTYWAAIQAHMEHLGDLPKPTEPTVPPPGGLPGPAPAAGGAVPDLTVPEAAPAPGRPPVPEAGPPAVAPGAAPPPAGGALPLEAHPTGAGGEAALGTPATPLTGAPAVPPAVLASGPPEAIVGIGLPRSLAKGSPRYGYSGTNYELSFADDIDKALYIVGNATKRSKADAQYLEFLQRALPGASEADLRGWGGQVRNVIKGLAREAGPDEALLEIPQTYTSFRTAAPVAEAALPRTPLSPPEPLAPPGIPPAADALSFAEQQRLRALTEQGMSQQDAVQMIGREQFPPAEATVLADIAAHRAAGQEILPAYGALEQTILQGRRNPFGPLRGPEVPPPPLPEGPLPLTPYERFGSEVGQTEAPVGSLDELVNAQYSRAATARATEEPLANIAAAARLADARAAREADLAAAFPSHAQLLSADMAPAVAATREALATHVGPGQMGEVAAYGGRLATAVDKIIPDLDRARELRTAAGLPDTATLKDVIGSLRKDGSDLTGEAQTIQDRWKSDILTGDLAHIVHQSTLKEYLKAKGLDPDRFGGPAWLADITAAWRAQALLSGAFHVKNVADSVIKSYFDSGSPGFLAGAQPWKPEDLAGLIKAAWRDTGPTNPNAAISPQLRVWGAIHELPVFDTMFAANNPTLTQALKALPPEDYKNVLAQLTPVERELMRVDPTLAVPSSIKEAVGPLETGGFLGKIPFVDRVLAFNLKLTMGIEQSARGAKFIDAYNNGIQAGLSKGDAYQQGIAEANRLFFDYQGNMTNADRLMRNIFGFHTFATRNLNYYAPILASNPVLIQGLKAWDDYSNQMAEEGGYAANRRFAESMKIPMVGGIGGGIAQFLFGRQGQLFWNPAVYLSIAEQTLSTPQEYRDEPLLGQVLSKARTFGLGLAPWVDIPLQMAGAYGARGPQSVTSLDSLLESAGQTALGRPVELPWKTVQRIRPPGQATPAALDIAVRQRLGEMSLEERPDFAQVSPGQPIHPDFVRAMAEGPGNPLYEEAARDVGKERLAGVALGKVVGGGPGFQSQMAGRMAEALGNQPKDLTKLGRQQYLAGRQAALAPEDLPLLTARREIGVKGLNEPGSQPAGEPAESPQAYIARVWPAASPARQWALLQTQDPAMKEAIMHYVGSRIRLH